MASLGFLLRRHVTTRLMAWTQLPAVGKVCMRLAGAMRGPYKDRRVLANLTENPYVSPRAQIFGARLEIGPQCFIDDNVTIYAHPDAGEVRLGRGVHVYRGTIIEVGQGGSVIIGDHTHIQSGCNIKGFLGSTIIGQHVQVAPRCGFSPYEHSFDRLDVDIQDQQIVSSGDISVGDNAWLGLSVQVLDGVQIGSGAVVGAGAVVTKSLPPNCVAVGVPARVLRIRESSDPAQVHEDTVMAETQ